MTSCQNILSAPSKMRLCRNNGSRSAFRYLCSTTDFVTIEWHPKSIGGNLQLEAAPPLHFQISENLNNLSPFAVSQETRHHSHAWAGDRACRNIGPGIWTPKTADGAAPGFGQALICSNIGMLSGVCIFNGVHLLRPNRGSVEKTEY